MNPQSSPNCRIDPLAIDYKSIPVQSEIIAGILRLDVELDSCFHELEGYVRSDPGVATLVLRIVNSAFYSRGREITNISRAISILGFNVVRSLSMLSFSRSLFKQSRHHMFETHVWQHSLLTAIAGQAIYRDICAGPDVDQAFIAGLMHDIGKVLLFNHTQEGYLHVLAMVIENGWASTVAERQVLGCDHTQVGAEAVARWKLPARFAAFMAADLSTPRAEWSDDPVCLSLAAANCLVGGNGIGARREPDTEAVRDALMALGVKECLCERWLHEDFMAGLIANDAYQLCATL